MSESASTFASISTPSQERALHEFSHLFEVPELPGDMITASPPRFANIVLKTKHNANIDLDVLFNVLPIVKISPISIQRSKEDYNNLFISIRKYPKARGYREPSKIKSFVDMDFFFMDRPFHMKISAANLTIVGGQSLEVSEKLIKTVYHHFKVLNDTWVGFADMSREKIIELSNKFVKNEPPEDPEDQEFYRILDSIIDRNEEDVMERLQNINPLVGRPLYEHEPEFSKLVTCNSVYNYRLPTEICLQEVATNLHKKGYEVIVHTCIIIKQMKATWIDPENGNKFSFSIQNIGTIKQNSSNTHEESLRMYEKMVRDLGFEPYREGSPYATKTKSKIVKHIEKSEECLELLNQYLTTIKS